MLDRHDLNHDASPLPAPAVDLTTPTEKPILAAASGAELETPPVAAEEEGDFLASFFGGEEPEGLDHGGGLLHATEPETMQGIGEDLVAFQSSTEQPAPVNQLEAEPVVAERDLRQLFAMKSADAALALAAMPHYEIGGKNSVRVSQLEMRWLAAEAKATLADTSVSRPVEDEDGDRIVVGHLVEHHEAVAAEAEATIRGLVDQGYLRPVRLTPDEARGQGELNALLVRELPEDWKGLASGADSRLAYEMTDAGIAAGRSLRGWDGKTPEAGLVRLPEAQAMPPIVSSESYALSAMIMENRSLAGALRQGEMGAFYRAELATIEYGLDHGADAVTTAGRLDSVINSASFVALEQVEESIAVHDAPLSTADLDGLSVASHRILDKLPDALEVHLENGEQAWMSLDKPQSRVLLARLDGVRMGTELINRERELAPDTRELPEAWENRVTIRGGQNSLAIRDALAVAKGFLARAAEQPERITKEVMAMAKGAFGESGSAMARQLLEGA